MSFSKQLQFGVCNTFIDTQEFLPKFTRIYNKELPKEKIVLKARKFANFIQRNSEKIKRTLTKYETYEVASDEIERCLDLLKNLDKNILYFEKEVGSVSSFLPRNQPLYSFCCFGVVPSLMAREVFVKAPSATHHFFFDLVKQLKIKNFFPNLTLSHDSREDFIKKRSAIKFDRAKNQFLPVTDAVIFTGTMENADKVRKMFDTDVLFISNGAGHNPMIIAPDANLLKAAESVIRIQLYNQGQDCANANSILVHKDVYEEFLKIIRKKLSNVKVGPYSNPENKVGPMSERKDLKRVQEVLVDNAEWLDHQTSGRIETKTALVSPALICKPLKEGGNFSETFAPIFFIQKYDKDSQLSEYFEDSRYARNAMYVSIFGTSKYVETLVTKVYGDGKILHTKETIIRNTDLHAPGIERGINPYGGYGRGASCVSIYGFVFAKPTLPQRDLFEYLVEFNKRNSSTSKDAGQAVYAKKFVKQKYLKIKEQDDLEVIKEYFFDASALNLKSPLARISSKDLYCLNQNPNYAYAKFLSQSEMQEIKKLIKILDSDFASYEELEALMFEFVKKKNVSPEKNKENQKTLFRNLYNLLLGKDSGPRIAKLIFSADRKQVKRILAGAIENRLKK